MELSGSPNNHYLHGGHTPRRLSDRLGQCQPRHHTELIMYNHSQQLSGAATLESEDGLRGKRGHRYTANAHSAGAHRPSARAHSHMHIPNVSELQRPTSRLNLEPSQFTLRHGNPAVQGSLHILICPRACLWIEVEISHPMHPLFV